MHDTPRNLPELALLAVIWGASFLRTCAFVLRTPVFALGAETGHKTPAVNRGPAARAMAAALAVFCTGAACVLYFRLIASAGPSNAIAVTFLVPVFAMLWGALISGEQPTLAMLAGCAVILLGTGLAHRAAALAGAVTGGHPSQAAAAHLP